MSEKIVNRNTSEQFREDYIRYAIYITFRRVLSDYRDGLKPVQRRILTAAYYDSKAINENVKTASVVGDVMKKYHPHGDAGIEGTIKPMVNWFESYLPLLDKQGNFGSFQGDPASASRYTECRLSKFSLNVILGDLIETDNCVDWTPTYDDKDIEPEYLPVKIPLMLINGSFGIGLGLKSEIPSHNINEVIDATIQLIKDPESDVILRPDHCMPCYIYDTDWKKICDNGFGHYRIRGIIDIEDYKGTKALIIKSVPNLTYLDNVTDKIEQLIAEKKVVQIDRAFDESHIAGVDKNGKYRGAKKGEKDIMRYVILLKPGADPEFVREVIYRNTKMEQKNRINLETLNGLNLMRMSYRSYLLSFIDLRKITKFRVYSNRLQDVQTKIHEREAFIAALESGQIDEIIALIRKNQSSIDNDLIEKISKMLHITDLQASYIVNVNLKRLSIGYLNKYKEEAIQFRDIQQDILAHLTDPRLIEQDIINELLEIKEKYGCPRRCKIIKPQTESAIPRGEMTIVITEKNYIKKVPLNAPIGNFKNDSIRCIIRADNASNILIFDDMGRVFKLLVHNIPFSDKNSNGTDIRFLIKGLTSNICTVIEEDAIKNIIAMNKNPKYMKVERFILVVTKLGLIKRMSLDDFITIPPSGILYAKLDENDSVKDIQIHAEYQDIIIYSDRKAVRLSVSEFPFLKRNTKGSRAMANAGEIDGMCPIMPDVESDLIVITRTGKINRLHVMSNLPNTGRGKNGFNLIKLNKGDSIHTVLTCNPTDIINVKTLNGTQQIHVEDIKYGSSISTGYALIPTRGDQIIRCFITRK